MSLFGIGKIWPPPRPPERFRLPDGSWMRPPSAPVARCPYCARYGDLGQCQGCGAPNEPIQPAIERTSLHSKGREFTPATLPGPVRSIT